MDRFIDHVIPQTPGCPKSLMKIELLRGAIEFCRDSHIWQIDAETEVLADASTITLTIADESTVTGCRLSISSKAFNQYTRSGVTVTLDNAVTSDTTFEVTTFLKPDRAATGLPDILYDDWFEAIESYAKYSLMMMPEKTWSNPQLARINYSKYLEDLGSAKIKAMQTNDQTRLMVQQRSFV
ncbi:hypothetical protein [Desulfobacula sp.]|uniref:hypothetical protein n=1 Tax=Desulfobacula sp. TaxID=2593537 RepID=UPI002606B8E8|nr:hypothetical protein [Desulfobacula sp.]